MCRENKGADQLRGYHAADLRLCFHACKKAGIVIMCLYIIPLVRLNCHLNLQPLFYRPNSSNRENL